MPSLKFPVPSVLGVCFEEAKEELIAHHGTHNGMPLTLDDT